MIRLKKNKALYPLIAILSSILIFVGSLLFAKKEGYLYLGAILIILLIFGLYKEILKVLPFTIILASLYFGITYAVSNNIDEAIYGIVRIAGLCVAIIPGISFPPVNLSRALNQLKAPRSLSLGILITLRFFPILGKEIITISSAMKTRGIKPSLKTLYRAVILPFCLNLVNISDVLALSLETRCFGIKKNPTSYKKIYLDYIDIIYIILIITLFVLGILYLLVLGV